MPTPTVSIGSSWPLAGINPTSATNPLGAAHPGCRGVDQLVIYQAPLTVTPTNRWGVEVTVNSSGVVVAVSDRERQGLTAGTVIPPGCRVLSGHRAAAEWLRRYAPAGATVTLPDGETTPTTPTPTTPTPTTPTPTTPTVPRGRTVAIYMMDGLGSIGQIPPECSQVRVAFVQGGGLVEWGGDSPARTAADLRSWRSGAASREVLPSIGGQGGAVDMATIGATIRRIETAFPCDGIDWDVEASALDVSRVVGVSIDLARGRESTWLTAFTPPGGPPVAVYLDAARRCQDAGLRVQFGQQLYDTRITLDDVLRQTALAVARLGERSVVLGCMVGNDPARYSTVTQWESYMRAIRDRWPNIGGAYLWESSRPGTAEWARRIAGVLR